jgi:hypothetical protein
VGPIHVPPSQAACTSGSAVFLLTPRALAGSKPTDNPDGACVACACATERERQYPRDEGICTCSCCQTQVHGAGGAPRQAQVFTAGRGMAAFAFPQAGKFMHSCLQDVVPPAGILIPAIPVADIPDRNAICGRNANCGRMQIAALPLHSPARRQHLRLPGGATGAMDRYKMYARLAQRPYLAHLRFEHSCRVLVCPLRGEGVESHVRGGRGRERGGAGWSESTGGAAGRAARTPNMLAAAHSSASSQGGVT